MATENSKSKALAVDNSFIAVIERAAADPNVDISKMQQLLDMQERIMVKNAEIAFGQAMARLQPRLPVISRTTKGHNSKYAKYEDVDSAVRQLYTEEGFSISFTTKKNEYGEIYYGTLHHVDGHSQTAEIALEPDTSGSKNAVQAKASTMSYAKRYLIAMLLNIVTKDEDDDGLAGGTRQITDEMAKEIERAISKLPDGKEWKPKFLEYMKAEDITSIPFKSYGKAINAIKTKEAQK